MKKSKPGSQKRAAAAAVQVTPPQSRIWPYALTLFLALGAVFQVYWPALNGPFLLDDSYMPYMLPQLADAPLRIWVSGLRPLLAFSFWLNFQQSGNQSTFGYHVVNVILHFCNGVLVFLAVRKALSWVETEKWHAQVLALFAAGLFLFHALQTESVSYVASRSETLSVFFVLAAFVVFIYRRSADVRVGTAAAVLVLFGAAALVKEHTAVFPALLLLTDYYWNPGFSLQGIRRNWKLYAPLLLAGAVGLALVWRVLNAASSAGFHLKDLTWYQYFFTQCRVIWDYLLAFLLPWGLNADHDFPISHGVIEHGAIFGLIALAAVTAIAWIYRRRFPLASFGWLTFLLLLAPTSSFVPLQDPIAERRLYLPFIGLLFITVEFLRRWKAGKTTLVSVLAVVLLAEAYVTYGRNELWGNAISLWKDTVAKSPNKLRPRFQLAFAEYQAGNCTGAVDDFGKAAQLRPPDFALLLDWALAYDCAAQPDQAIEKLRQAANIEGSAHVYSQIGMEYGKTGRYAEALDALNTASQLDPNFAMTYYTRGAVYEAQGNKVQAAAEYRHALVLDRHIQAARDALVRLGQ
jgi:Tfp pilus assembly protein PilF/uncharacterized membrane protein